MIDRKVIELSSQPPEQPELEIMLRGCVTDAERKAVREAFYTFSRGDPGGFSVQFAELLQAHARVLKCAPERLRKALAMELTPVTDVISSNPEVDPSGHRHSLPNWHRQLPSPRRGDQLAGENTLSSRKNTIAKCGDSKRLGQANVTQSFQLFPIIQGRLEINGKDWKQKALIVSNYFHSAADLARSDREDACGKCGPENVVENASRQESMARLKLSGGRAKSCRA